MQFVATAYYCYGFIWLLSGVITGWLRWEGHPIAIALWIITGAAAWPWILFKILRDVRCGRDTTDLM